MIRKSLIILIFLSFNNYSQNIFNFLKIDYAPRAAALAGIFVNSTDDPSSMFYNPATVYFGENGDASFSFSKFLLDINGASFASIITFDESYKFGIGARYINYGSFTKADESGNKLGSFGANDFALTIAYSYYYFENFYIGAGANFIYSGIDKYSSTAFSFDFGALYNIPEYLINMGISLNNFGSQISAYSSKKEKLPLDLRIGVSKKLAEAPLKFYAGLYDLVNERLNFTDRLKRYSFAIEFDPGKTLIMRLGYDANKRKELKIASSAGLAGISLGLGLRFENLNFDYSYSSWGEIGAIHRVGVILNFNKF